MRQHAIEENEAGMEIPVYIDREYCSACGFCVKICPIRIFKQASDTGIVFRMDQLSLCIKCGQCMAICPSQSIIVDGLDYSRDFFAIPKVPVVEMSFLEMIKIRRAIRVFKDKPVPKELLEKIVEAITYAPPGFTPNKTEVVVVQDTEVIRQALPEMIKVYDNLVNAMNHPISRFFIHSVKPIQSCEPDDL